MAAASTGARACACVHADPHVYIKAQRCALVPSPPWEFPSVPGSNSLLEPQLYAWVCAHARAPRGMRSCARFLSDSQASALLNVPLAFVLTFQLNFPAFIPPFRPACPRAQECARFDRAPQLCVSARGHVPECALRKKNGEVLERL